MSLRLKPLGIIALFVVALQLASCGFHPRGSVTRLTDLGSIFIDASRNLSIADDVRDALMDAAFLLAPNRDDADIILRLTGEEQRERVVSVRSTGRVSELEISHAVDMLIAEPAEDTAAETLMVQSSNRVEVIREYTYDETGVLGKDNEARILRSEMKDELVRQIVLRTIASLAPSIAPVSVNQSGRIYTSAHAVDAVDYLVR